MNAFERTNPNQVVVFTLDEPRYALPLAAVERVVRTVEITLLPKAPDIVLGVIDTQGRIVPVVDVRTRFRLPPREMDVDDRFIIARTSRRIVALLVDSVIGVRTLADSEVVSAEQALPFAEYLQGVAKVEDGIVLIYDLEQFLSLDEQRILDAALSGGAE
jgi:purine-binding chemotaxis protein CheW